MYSGQVDFMLKSIKTDIGRLLSMYETEKNRAESLASELEESRLIVLNCKEQITELNQEIDNLKLQSAFMAGGDSVQARERLDKLIKEIDKCIKLLEN